MCQGCYGTSTGWKLQIPGASNNIQLQGPRAATQDLITTSATAGGAPNIRDGNWHLVTAVSDGNSPLTPADIHLYIDGVEMTGAKVTGSGSVTNTAIQAGVVVSIGNEDGQGLEFPGNLCHAAAWGFALSTANVTELYGSGVPQDLLKMSFAAPVFWDTLGDGDAIEAGNMIDLSVNTNHGTAEAAVDAGDFVSDVPT